jgi:hypothetical protein
MNIDELKQNPIFKLPVERNDGRCFYSFVRDKLSEYQALVKQLDDPQQGIDNLCKGIDNLCVGIIETLRLHYMGLRSNAYSHLSNALYPIFENNQYAILRLHNPLYRIRIFEPDDILTEPNELMKGLFHIPYHKIELVKNERYSLIGHPSLYLGSSIFGCCKEMDINENDIEQKQVYVSRFEGNDEANQEPIHVLDLSLKNLAELDQDEGIYWYLQLFPLILACSITVKDRDKDFKPEYIIPQLVLECVRNVLNDKRFKIRGIAYSSTRITDEDIEYPEKLYNVVLPTGVPSNKGYCDRLRKILNFTIPDRLTIPELPTNPPELVLDVQNSNKPHETLRLNPHHQPSAPYYFSIYGKMENNIDNKELKVLDFDEQQEIPNSECQTN